MENILTIFVKTTIMKPKFEIPGKSLIKLYTNCMAEELIYYITIFPN